MLPLPCIFQSVRRFNIHGEWENLEGEMIGTDSVVPLFMMGNRDKSRIYRPISLISEKLLETIILGRICSYLKKHGHSRKTA